MVRRGVGRARLGLAAIAVVPALALAGCSNEIDSGKAEQLIRAATTKLFASDIHVKSVSCPSGVTAKTGGTFNCNITLVSAADGATKSGTVTVHMTNSSGHAEVGGSDFHLH
jgi:NAD(P)H-hydrate repair Nnr-like enzyme with NAD(P)H-hydrate epimerase domain